MSVSLSNNPFQYVPKELWEKIFENVDDRGLIFTFLADKKAKQLIGDYLAGYRDKVCGVEEYLGKRDFKLLKVAIKRKYSKKDACRVTYRWVYRNVLRFQQQEYQTVFLKYFGPISKQNGLPQNTEKYIRRKSS